MTTSMWICAPLPLHGTSHGKLLIWLNLGCKGTHGGRLGNCNLSELHFSSLISLLALLERLFLFFHKTTHSFLARCKGRSPKRKFQSREEFFRGAAVSPLPIGSGFYVEILAEKFISSQVSSFPQARTGSQCIVPVSHSLWSTGGHFETSSSYCGVKNIARKAFRLFNLSMWRHW